MTAADRSAPGVRVALVASGTAQPLELRGRLVSFKYEDHDAKADVCSLEFDNFDLSVFDRQDLAGGSLLEVSWGYPGRMSPARRVVVRRMKGFGRLTIECHGESALLDRQARTRRFEGRTTSEVAREVARELGYDDAFLDIEDTTERHDVIVQHGETDARFLARLAARQGFAFTADQGRLSWRQPARDVAPTHVFTYYTDPNRGDVLDVQVESDLGRRVGRVTVRGRDPRTRTTIDANATAETTPRTTLAEVVEIVDPETGRSELETRTATSSVRTTTAPSQQEAHQEAHARFRRAEERSVKLRVQVVGDPTLQPRSIIEMRGISRLLSGRYYVRAVHTSVSGSGYTSELELQRDGVGRHARHAAREQSGTPNRETAEPANHDEAAASELVEAVDGETGRTELRYRAARGATR